MEGIPTDIVESKEKLKILYTGFFVKNISELTGQFPPKHGKVYGHHSTIAFKPPTLDSIQVGTETSLKIIGRVTDEKGDALLVESPKSNNAHPHITLSCAEGTSPFYSNEMIERAFAANQVTLFDSPIYIDVVEGYFDGKKDVIAKEE